MVPIDIRSPIIIVCASVTVTIFVNTNPWSGVGHETAFAINDGTHNDLILTPAESICFLQFRTAAFVK
jgi:hypothetical protein